MRIRYSDLSDGGWFVDFLCQFVFYLNTKHESHEQIEIFPLKNNINLEKRCFSNFSKLEVELQLYIDGQVNIWFRHITIFHFKPRKEA